MCATALSDPLRQSNQLLHRTEAENCIIAKEASRRRRNDAAEDEDSDSLPEVTTALGINRVPKDADTGDAVMTDEEREDSPIPLPRKKLTRRSGEGIDLSRLGGYTGEPPRDDGDQDAGSPAKAAPKPGLRKAIRRTMGCSNAYTERQAKKRIEVEEEEEEETEEKVQVVAARRSKGRISTAKASTSHHASRPARTEDDSTTEVPEAPSKPSRDNVRLTPWLTLREVPVPDVGGSQRLSQGKPSAPDESNPEVDDGDDGKPTKVPKRPTPKQRDPVVQEDLEPPNADTWWHLDARGGQQQPRHPRFTRYYHARRQHVSKAYVPVAQEWLIAQQLSPGRYKVQSKYTVRAPPKTKRKGVPDAEPPTNTTKPKRGQATPGVCEETQPLGNSLNIYLAPPNSPQNGQGISA
ncbi:hypothetical protein IMY05_C4483000100 [Salix suchowensis]|nr:hypothetical protein IMY05_C4483000100 [Salix suchowensis]